MGNPIDMTGLRFGRWRVISRGDDSPSGIIRWNCICDCGQERLVYGTTLRNGSSKGCKTCGGNSLKNIIIGNRFGQLTVIDRGIDDKYRYNAWLCKCDCGNEKIVVGAKLRSGQVSSCGCAKNNLPKGDGSINILLRKYIYGANIRNIEFNITRDEFKILTSSNCYYCGREPYSVIGKDTSSIYTYNGIDRIDSNVGYTIENCVPCCKECNMAKGTMTYDHFINMCRLVVENYLRRIS